MAAFSDLAEDAAVVGGGHQQQRAGSAGQLGLLHRECPFEASGQRQPRGTRSLAQVLRPQDGRQLHQRERIARCLLEQPLAQDEGSPGACASSSAPAAARRALES